MPLPAESRRRVAIVLRAFLYAAAATALVLFARGGEHVFIYQGF